MGYTIFLQADAWTGQIDALEKRLAGVDGLIEQLADATVLPILGRHYDESGLKVKSGRMRAAVTQRGAPGNTFQKTATGMVVGIDYAVIPYAQYMIEGTKPHDIPGAFGRGLGFGVGGRFAGKFHPGNAPHQIYFLSPADLADVEKALMSLVREGDDNSL